MSDPNTTREDGLLTVRVERDDGAVIVRPRGELDIASAKTLEAELRRAIASDAAAVVLDLGSLSFIDSTGLRVLLLAAKLSSTNGIQLRMLNGSWQVKRVLEVTRLDSSLPLAH